MKFLTTVPVILFSLLFFSAKPATISKSPSASAPDPNPNACTYRFVVDNTGGTHTINHVKVEWPGYVGEWYPSIAGGTIQGFETTYNPAITIRYMVKVTIGWSAPAIGPKIRLVTNSDSKMIGNFNSLPTATLSSAIANGNGPNGQTAIYCHGVTVYVTESI